MHYSLSLQNFTHYLQLINSAYNVNNDWMITFTNRDDITEMSYTLDYGTNTVLVTLPSNF